MRKPTAKSLRRTAPARRLDAARQARIDLAAAYRLAARFGLNEGICNHFTLAVPGRADRFLVIGHGLDWSEVTASNLIEVDLAGTVINGDRPVEATAFYIHARLHQALPQAACVLHTHMPYATAITSLEGGRLEMCTQNALRYWGRIAYDDDYRGVALSNAEGDRLAGAIGDKAVGMLANHGVIVVGASVAAAFSDLYYLERACLVQVLAQSSGGRLKRVPPGICAAVSKQIAGDSAHYAGLHFDAWKRQLDPGYQR